MTSDRANCPACGGPAGEHLVLREMMFGTRERYAYSRCDRCDSLWITRVPLNLARHYPPAYYANHASVDVTQDALWRRSLIRPLVARRVWGRRSPLLPLARRLVRMPDEYRRVRTIVEGGGLTSFDDPILDVGCGAEPARLAILRKLGFRHLLGVEPFLAANTNFQGVPVRKGFLDHVGGSFALIMFNHSLEHVPDPVATLTNAVERLRPAGSILVRTPVMGTHLWRKYRTDWVELDPPRHLVLFSLAGLEAAAAVSGLAITSIVWESAAWEFVASEQYLRNIGMTEAGSWFVDPNSSAFDEATLADFRAEARRINAAGDAGRAAILLRKLA